MTTRRRTVEVFTLSFLDCICCGFGAVILFYTIVSAQADVRSLHSTDPLQAEVNRLNEQVLSGDRDLVRLRNQVESTESETASDAARTRVVLATLDNRREQLSTEDAATLARRARIEKLKADIRALQESQRRLEAGSLDTVPPGQRILSFRDSGGDRRYLTGVRLHGKRILILVDISGSMLHEDLASIVRLRNASDDQKRAASKW